MCRIINNLKGYAVAWNRYITALLACYLALYLPCLILLCSIANAADEMPTQNHFRANNHRELQPTLQTQSIDPLTTYPLALYVVHGVVITEDNAIAIVYTPRNTWHKLRVPAQLGQEQAVVHKITTQGIQVEMQGTLLWLPVLE